MKLNDCQIRNAKPTEAGKKAKLFDGGGLYLEVTPAGGKIFRLKYRIVHVEEDRIRAAYLGTDYMNERHEIKWYSNYLCERCRQALKQI
ncbi:integrase family protein [Neisseria elongata]|uniref:Arm DNA-binding domain-containing protein n=1 Tax=Neisseria elongata TaxID=495 RepID=UPI0028E74E5D|nr:integrase family protein [Neisseria elongata]